MSKIQGEDKSHAKWPDGMKWCSPDTIFIDDDTEVVYLLSEDLSGNNSDVGEMINRHRFGQICALPKMVELLREIVQLDDEMKINVGSVRYSISAILREIGEIE